MAKLTVYDKLALATRVVVLTCATGFATRPTDSPPNVEVHGSIRVPAKMRRDVVDKGLLTGPSSISTGTLVIANESGDLDFLAHCAFDGWECVIKVAEDTTAIYPSDFHMVFNGTMEQMTRNDAEIRVKLRAVEFFAEKPLQEVLYAGDNTLPGGLEGYGSDVKDKPKMLALGRVLNATGVMVNTDLLIEHWHRGALDSVSAMYGRGGLIPADPAGDYTDESDMLAVQPTPGYFRQLRNGVEGAYTRRGAADAGLVTADLWEGKWPADRTTAQIFKRIATTYGGLTSGQVSASDIAAFDAVQPGTIGLDFKEPTTVGNALDNAIKGQGGVRFSDNDGVLRLRRLSAPSGTSVATFSDDGDPADGTILAFDQAEFGDNDAGLPVWKVNALGVPLSTVQTDNLLGSIGAQRRARLAQKYLTRSASAPSVKTAHKLAREITVETRLMCETDLQNEADRLLELFSVRRGRFEAVVEAPFSVIRHIDLLSLVTIRRNRYGMQTGVQCVVLGLEWDAERNVMAMTLWGEV